MYNYLIMKMMQGERGGTAEVLSGEECGRGMSSRRRASEAAAEEARTHLLRWLRALWPNAHRSGIHKLFKFQL